MADNMTLSIASDNGQEIEINSFRKTILGWYDAHARALPWRAVKTRGEKANPYHVWLSEVMLQQTTVVTVAPYFEKFIRRWPEVADLAAAPREDVMHEWAGLGYYARARNLHKCAQVVTQEYEGKFPDTQAVLVTLPGIGAYTSAAIAAIAFDRPANVVDGNIERVMARLFTVKDPLPGSKKHLAALAGQLSEGRRDRAGDYAQALMDLGAGVCTPTSPKCGMCPVQKFCSAYVAGIQGNLPKKIKKKPKPYKRAAVYWVVNKKKEVLFVRRPENEMLGGMLGLPTGEWKESQTVTDVVSGAKQQNLVVKHSFTHFDLSLEIYSLSHKKGIFPPENNHNWVALSKIEELGLPTLFKKVVNLMK